MNSSSATAPGTEKLIVPLRRQPLECFALAVSSASPAIGAVVQDCTAGKGTDGKLSTDILCKLRAAYGVCLMPAAVKLLPPSTAKSSSDWWGSDSKLAATYSAAVASKVPCAASRRKNRSGGEASEAEGSGGTLRSRNPFAGTGKAFGDAAVLYRLQSGGAGTPAGPDLATAEELVHSECYSSDGNDAFRNNATPSIASSSYLSPEEVLAVLLRHSGGGPKEGAPGRKGNRKRILLSGDSIMRQFFMRLVALLRSVGDDGTPGSDFEIPTVEQSFQSDASYLLLRSQRTMVMKDRLVIMGPAEAPHQHGMTVEDFFDFCLSRAPNLAFFTNSSEGTGGEWEVVLQVDFLWDHDTRFPRVVTIDKMKKGVQVGASYGMHIFSYAYWWPGFASANTILPILDQLQKDVTATVELMKTNTKNKKFFRQIVFLTTPNATYEPEFYESTKQMNAMLATQAQLVAQWCRNNSFSYYPDGQQQRATSASYYRWSIIDAAWILAHFINRPLPISNPQAYSAVLAEKKYRCDGMHAMCSLLPHVGMVPTALKARGGHFHTVCHLHRCHDDVDLAVWQWLAKSLIFDEPSLSVFSSA